MRHFSKIWWSSDKLRRKSCFWAKNENIEGKVGKNEAKRKNKARKVSKNTTKIEIKGEQIRVRTTNNGPKQQQKERLERDQKETFFVRTTVIKWKKEAQLSRNEEKSRSLKKSKTKKTET